jgi:hypothetical protein
MVAGWIWSSLMEMGKINPSDYEMLDKGLYHPDQFPENALLTKDLTLGYLPPLKAFLPSELRSLLETCGMRVLRCGAIGSLAGLLGPDVVRRAQENPETFEEFIAFCDRYDREILPHGAGTRERAGLLAVAERTT